MTLFRPRLVVNASVRQQSLTWNISRLCLVCGEEGCESGKETFKSQTLRNWSRWTRLNSTPEGPLQRKCWRRWKVKISYSQSQMEQLKLPGSCSENIHLNRWPPRQRRRTRKNLGESVGSSTTSRQDSSWYWWSQAWFVVYFRRFLLPSPPGTQSQTVRAERRIILYSTEIYWHYQNFWHYVGFDVGETCWRLLERWWSKRIIGCMDGFHKIHLIAWETIWKTDMVRWEVDEKTDDFKTRQCMARCVETHVWCIKT